MEAYPPQDYDGSTFIPSQWNYADESTTLGTMKDEIAALKLEILDGVSNEDLNSIKEIADSLNNDADFGTTMLASLATTVKLTTNQTISGVKLFSDISLGGTDLQTSLDNRVDTYSVQSVGGQKTFTGPATFTNNNMTLFNGNNQ
jgi:hypothetical protein